MKNLFLYCCLPFFLPVVLIAFFVACFASVQPVPLGMAGVLDLSEFSGTAQLDLSFLAVSVAAALVLQLIIGIPLLKNVIAVVPTVFKATLCSLIACVGVSFLVGTVIAYLLGSSTTPLVIAAVAAVGVPAFFGCLVAWRILHPYPRWEEPGFPM